MTTEELFQSTINELSITNIHSLHKLMMEECCERALQDNLEVIDTNTLVFAVRVAFLTCNSALKATLNSSLESTNADQVTLNYRGETFIISKDSNFLK